MAQDAGVSRTPWQMNKGGAVYDLEAPLGAHGAVEAYVFADIPAANDSAWQDAPNPDTIGFGSNTASIIPPGKCLNAVDYTYFQTFVTVPDGVKVTQLRIAFQGMDDGSRISIFNAQNTSGSVVDGSYVRLGGKETTDLKDLMVKGRNRIVITQVDDCPLGNQLQSATVEMNGQLVPTSAARDNTGTGGDATSSADLSDLALEFNGDRPLLTASCLKGEPVLLTGVHNIEGQLQFGEGDSTFQSSCMDTSIAKTAGDVTLNATCRTSAGQMRQTSLSLQGSTAMKELMARSDCGGTDGGSGGAAKFALSEMPRGADIRDHIGLASNCDVYLDRPSPGSTISYTLTFANQSKEDRLVAWVNFETVPVAIASLPPGGSHKELTYEGHRFLIVGPDGRCLAMHGVGNHDYQVDIQ
jgi:hypothetical protein